MKPLGERVGDAKPFLERAIKIIDDGAFRPPWDPRFGRDMDEILCLMTRAQAELLGIPHEECPADEKTGMPVRGRP